MRVVEVAIEPKTRADQEKLVAALKRLARRDHRFGIFVDEESGLAIIAGESEHHLDAKLDVLIRTDNIGINIGAPQVAYRERLGCRAEVDYTHKKLVGVGGQFARVRIVFEPGEPGSGFVFDSEVVGGAVPKKYIPGIRKGLRQAKEIGLLAGFPIDFKATLVDGAYHNIDSSVLAFEIATRAAFRELREKGDPELLEPIMKVEVLTPDEYLGDLIGDLNSRRGQIRGIETRGDARLVTALVPMACLFGYQSTLRGMSQGRASFTLRYDHYAQVPGPPEDDDPPFPPAAAMRA